MNISKILVSLVAISMATSAYAKPVELILRLKERVSMEELAKNVSDPASPRFRKYYSAEEIKALSAPSASDYANLLIQLKAQGFKVVRESKSHLYVTVQADHSQVEKTFNTTFQISGNKSTAKFVGFAKRVSVPSALDLVSSVSGMDQTSRMHPHMKMPNMKGATASKGISQDIIKTAYGYKAVHSTGVKGKGQQIAIATYDGFHLSDIQAFYQKSGISPAPAVDQVKFNGDPAIKEDSAAETALDAEFSGMMAPEAKIHVFASAENSDAGELALFTAILDDGRAKILNYSWGTCETRVTPEHQADMDKVYARAAAQGVTILVASGDSGADGCGDGTKVADWPASQPFALAVGGTSFAMSAGKLDESGWSLGGGGISALYSLPDYQSHFQSPYNKRSMPDVAFNADQNTGEDIWTSYPDGNPKWLTIGGTSMAAPQWAGFIALVNQARAEAGKSSIGFLNPTLYAMSASDKANTLHDVTQGNNGYAAGPGWDAVTGFGSLQADQLIEYLVNQN